MSIQFLQIRWSFQREYWMWAVVAQILFSWKVKSDPCISGWYKLAEESVKNVTVEVSLQLDKTKDKNLTFWSFVSFPWNSDMNCTGCMQSCEFSQFPHAVCVWYMYVIYFFGGGGGDRPIKICPINHNLYVSLFYLFNFTVFFSNKYKNIACFCPFTYQELNLSKPQRELLHRPSWLSLATQT